MPARVRPRLSVECLECRELLSSTPLLFVPGPAPPQKPPEPDFAIHSFGVERGADYQLVPLGWAAMPVRLLTVMDPEPNPGELPDTSIVTAWKHDGLFGPLDSVSTTFVNLPQTITVESLPAPLVVPGATQTLGHVFFRFADATARSTSLSVVISAVAVLDRSGLRTPLAGDSSSGLVGGPSALLNQGLAVAPGRLVEQPLGNFPPLGVPAGNQEGPVRPGQGEAAPRPPGSGGAANLDPQESPPPQAKGAPAPALPPLAAGLLDGVGALPLAALERAVRALTAPEALAGDDAPFLLRWLGISSWLTGAALACWMARRRRPPALALHDAGGLREMDFSEEDRA
jgi:hypothetical protein